MSGFRIGPWRAVALAVVVFAVSTASGLSAQETDIGEATAVVKTVRGTIADRVRDIASKDRIFADELIQTGADSASQLKFLDDTVLTIGPNSDVVLDEFVFDAQPDQQKLVLNASVGVLRFVTGRLSKPGIQVKLPSATIGVRGSTWTMIIIPDADPSRPPRIEVSVKDGGIVAQVQQPGGGVQEFEVAVGQTLVVRPGEPPVVVPTPSVDVEAKIAEMDALLIVAGSGVTTDPEIEQALLDAIAEAIELRGTHTCAC